MKIVLSKPQRSVANSVLAYQYEPPDEQWYEEETFFSLWNDDAICRNNDCQREEGAGDCLLWSDGTSQACW